MKQVDKTILKLVYGISVMSLHLHYFHANGECSFGEGWRDDLGEEVESVFPSTLLACGRWKVRLEKTRERIWEREVEEL